MSFLTPRETMALTALVNSSPISGADLCRALTRAVGREVSPEATTALARSLVGQSLARRCVPASGDAAGDVYEATFEGRAWLEANT